METITVKDLMVPLEEYTTVSEESTLYEAVMALETAQEELDRTQYHYLHRAILVFNKDNHIVGKVSQLDVLRSLEPKYDEIIKSGKMSLAGFSPQFLKSMFKHYSLLEDSLKDMCVAAGKRRIKDVMYTPGEGEYVKETASMEEAIHQLVIGHHQSLLVIREKEGIVGILRLSDVFKEIFQLMKISHNS